MQSLSPSSPCKVVGGKVQCAFEHYLAVVAYFARDINSNTIGINACATENSTLGHVVGKGLQASTRALLKGLISPVEAL